MGRLGCCCFRRGICIQPLCGVILDVLLSFVSLMAVGGKEISSLSMDALLVSGGTVMECDVLATMAMLERAALRCLGILKDTMRESTKKSGSCSEKNSRKLRNGIR